jgi:ComF family protein
VSGKSRRRILISFLRNNVSSIAKLAELIFFPSFCELCSALLESSEERVICRSCWEGMIPFPSSYCLCCGRFFEGSAEPHLCRDCLEKRPDFTYHRSYGRYRGKLKDAILLFKYRRFQVLGGDFARLIFRRLGKEENIWWKADVILPVPLHPKRLKKRGFNQAQVIAAELARIKGIKLEERALVKVKNVLPQTFLETEERKKNVSGAFRIVDKEKIKGKTVILVDDVYTTGSTVRECSMVLKKAGAKEVRVLTLAQA